MIRLILQIFPWIALGSAAVVGGGTFLRTLRRPEWAVRRYPDRLPGPRFLSDERPSSRADALRVLLNEAKIRLDELPAYAPPDVESVDRVAEEAITSLEFFLIRPEASKN